MDSVLTATVQLLNRQAEKKGLNGRINRAAKSLVSLRKVRDGRTQIIISTSKDPARNIYDVDKIGVIRSRFLNEGLLTLEISEPPISILIRDSTESELKAFLDKLNEIKEKISNSPEALFDESLVIDDTEQPSTSKGTRGTVPSPKREDTSAGPAAGPLVIPYGRPRDPEPMPVKLNRTKLLVQSKMAFPMVGPGTNKRKAGDDLRRFGDAKRLYTSPEVSKREMNSLAKLLGSNKRTISLKILSRDKYPFSGFPETLQCLTINDIRLKKMDKNFLALKNLNVLDLCGNALDNVDNLKNLRAPLTMLKLSGNNIEKMNDDVFITLQSLKVLELNNNKLTTLPHSIVYLNKLVTLSATRNCLRYLPYNLHYLRSLQELNVKGNQLTFIPKTIVVLNLRKVDVSSNPIVSSFPNYQLQNGLGSETRVPSLLELAGEKLLNCNFAKNREKAFFNLDASVIPHQLKCYLYRGMMCNTCNRVTLRYSIREAKGCVLQLAETVITDSNHNTLGTNIKIATCQDCVI